jgi:hypothetical protein
MIRVRGLEQKQTRNRSSKHLRILAGFKPAIWGWNKEALEEAAHKCENCKGGNMYEEEIQRRLNNAAKRKTPRPVSPKKAAPKGAKKM